ncbi:MAG: mannose-6-phosphate isomerase, class I [Polyangiaceae bacterium]|nr:mannose-6-phosphate isomerase, class I [Polyangiaceae bacterium]
MIDKLACTIMPYAWGSHTAIAELVGRAAPATPTPGEGRPEAELWMGDHPLAPSSVMRQGKPVSLADIIATNPMRELGETNVQAFGARLPFLLKVLAAAQPLSLQAHPNQAHAEAGFDDEERRSISPTSAHRNYKDRSHKPELLCALGPFDALLGFRPINDTLALFDALDVAELKNVALPLRSARNASNANNDSGLLATVQAIMATPADGRAILVSKTVAACARTSGLAKDAFTKERAWTARLAGLYPDDIGVVIALLLNHVHLESGEAIYLGPGKLHAYLGGVGVEIMASSDNVLRGGLTPKHVDVPELLRVLDFTAGPVTKLVARAVDEVERVFDTPAREFRLSTLRLGRASCAKKRQVTRTTSGPEILLCTEGAVDVRSKADDAVRLERGACAFLGAYTGIYTLDGEGTLFRATVNA